MNQADLPTFAEHLNALAEVFGKAAIPTRAMKMWFETLSEFEAIPVNSTLRNWAKSNGKFPTPNDVWKSLNEGRSKSLEATAEAEKKSLTRWTDGGTTEHGRRAIQTIRRILATPKPDPRTHWDRVMATPGLPAISYRYAQAVIGKRNVIEREPGQDDEELAEAPI